MKKKKISVRDTVDTLLQQSYNVDHVAQLDLKQHTFGTDRGYPGDHYINRIADALDFALLTPEQYESNAKMMYKRGYKLV